MGLQVPEAPLGIEFSVTLEGSSQVWLEVHPCQLRQGETPNVHAKNLVQQGVGKERTLLTASDYLLTHIKPYLGDGAKFSSNQLHSWKRLNTQDLFYIADASVVSKTTLKSFGLTS